MCPLLFVWALSSLKNVLQRTLPNLLPTPSQQSLSSDEEGTGSQFFLSKTLRITPVRRQKDNKKEPRTIRNELLWTLLFYSVFALNAALKGTKLGAELGWFWVGQAQNSLLCQLSDLLSEVLLFLLDALALLEAHGILQGDGTAQFLSGGIHILLHSDVTVLDKGLLE